MSFPSGIVIKNLPAKAGQARDVGLIPGSGRSPGVGNGNPVLSGKSHGQRSLAGSKVAESNMTEATEPSK